MRNDMAYMVGFFLFLIFFFPFWGALDTFININFLCIIICHANISLFFLYIYIFLFCFFFCVSQGLVQYFIKLTEMEKNRKLTELLDVLEFNQVVIFVSKVARAKTLDKLLCECGFPSVCIHSGLRMKERMARYKEFKDFKKRILVATDLFGRGMDIEKVNIVINYDMADGGDPYLHRVGRAGRFGTKGLAISFITTEEDEKVLKDVQGRFEVNIAELPDQIDISTYMNA